MYVVVKNKMSERMNIQEEALKLVTEVMKDNDASHDINHVKRVVSLALVLAKMEGITDPDTLEVIELAAWLHDVGDYKYNKDKGNAAIADLFDRCNYPPHKRDRIIHVIENIGYRDELKFIERNGYSCHEKDDVLNAIHFVKRDPIYHTDELCIVQDADRLEALGAIGIARCLFYTASKGGIIHDPSAIPEHSLSSEEYAARSTSTKEKRHAATTHFREKLLKLQHLMKTESGKRIARERTAIMHTFIATLEDEWDPSSLLDQCVADACTFCPSHRTNYTDLYHDTLGEYTL
jgi:uncharacterized protein